MTGRIGDTDYLTPARRRRQQLPQAATQTRAGQLRTGRLPPWPEEQCPLLFAEVLLESLGEEVTSESDADRKLLAEADRRYRELVSGQVIGRSWEKVLATARIRLGS